MQRSPLVPGSTTLLVEVFRVGDLIARWKAAFDIDISEELAGLEEIALYRCEDSQLDFFVPASAEGSPQLYEQLGRLDWFYMPEKWEFEEGIRDLRGCDRILEVGCGPGFFLEKAEHHLTASTVKGTETNQSLVHRAVGRGLNVEQLELGALAARGEVFDAVCSFQVLEHAAQPRTLLSSMVSLLSSGGKLIICVPNKSSFLKHQCNLLDMPPHHMTRWSSYTLRYLERVFPLRLLSIRHEPLAPYHTRGYVTAYADYLCAKVPALRMVLSQPRTPTIARMLENSRLRRRLRGQSLYAVFERI
jgi:SAM-dependent methyltransferase